MQNTRRSRLRRVQAFASVPVAGLSPRSRLRYRMASEMWATEMSGRLGGLTGTLFQRCLTLLFSCSMIVVAAIINSGSLPTR